MKSLEAFYEDISKIPDKMGSIMPPQQKKKTVNSKKTTNASKAADDHIARMRAMGIMLDPKDSSGSEDE